MIDTLTTFNGRTLELPADSFEDLFESFTLGEGYDRPDDYRPIPIHERYAENMSIDPFFTIDGDGLRRHGWIRPTPELVECVERNMIAIDDDRVNFKIHCHSDGYALVVAHYGRILGNHYIARVRRDTVPAA